MALFPLCRHDRPPGDAIAHAAAAIEREVAGVSDRADLLTILAIFSELGYPDLDPHSIIGREKMEESKFYQTVLAEGKQDAKRDAILKALRVRCGVTVPKKLAAAVNAVTDLAELDRLFEAALLSNELDDFRAALGGK